jgi:hypothetical protein
MFWIPPIASTIMLLLGWRSGVILVPRPVTAGWAIALLFQGMAGLFSPLWVIGLVLQVIVALYLAFKLTLPS